MSGSKLDSVLSQQNVNILKGMVCPKCQLMCLGLEALLGHISKSHSELGGSSEIQSEKPCANIISEKGIGLYTKYDDQRVSGKTVNDSSITKSDKCDICGLTVKDAGALKKHIQSVHEFEKDHRCYYCEKSFKKYEHLKTHMKCFHSECERDNKCIICNRKFASFSSFQRHMKIVHEGAKDNVVCNFCNKTFAHIQNLKRHLKNFNKQCKKTQE